MRKLLIISAIIFSCNVPHVIVDDNNTNTPASTYSAKWKTRNELGVVNYQIQKSRNKRDWSVISTLLPKLSSDSNLYIFVLPPLTTKYYYRIVANMGAFNFNTGYIYTKTK